MSTVRRIVPPDERPECWDGARFLGEPWINYIVTLDDRTRPIAEQAAVMLAHAYRSATRWLTARYPYLPVALASYVPPTGDQHSPTLQRSDVLTVAVQHGAWYGDMPRSTPTRVVQAIPGRRHGPRFWQILPDIEERLDMRSCSHGTVDLVATDDLLCPDDGGMCVVSWGAGATREEILDEVRTHLDRIGYSPAAAPQGKPRHRQTDYARYLRLYLTWKAWEAGATRPLRTAFYEALVLGARLSSGKASTAEQRQAVDPREAGWEPEKLSDTSTVRKALTKAIELFGPRDVGEITAWETSFRGMNGTREFGPGTFGPGGDPPLTAAAAIG